jgi:hypothetical protein
MKIAISNMGIIRPPLSTCSQSARPTFGLKNRRKRAGWKRQLLGNRNPPDRLTFKRFAWSVLEPNCFGAFDMPLAPSHREKSGCAP